MNQTKTNKPTQQKMSYPTTRGLFGCKTIIRHLTASISVKAYALFSSSFLLLFSLSSKAQVIEYPPQDLSFVVGATANAPAAGTSFIKLQGSEDWNVRLFRGRLKQSPINDGSGIYYTKAIGSDTLKLSGDSWHTGELVQIEFYKASGTLSLDDTVVTESTLFAIDNPNGTPIGSSGSFTDPGGWTPVASTRKATGNGYIQFVPVLASGGSEGWFGLYDQYGNNWEVKISSSAWGVNHSGTMISSGNALSLANKYVFFERSGTTVTLKYATTPTGARTLLHTFSQPISATSAFAIGGIFNPPAGSGLTNAKISGQTVVSAAGPITQIANFTAANQNVSLSPGSYTTTVAGGATVTCTKKFTGDGYCQFKLKVQNTTNIIYTSILDDSGKDWNVAFDPSGNGGAGRLAIRYQGAEYHSSTNPAIFNHFFRFYRTGSTITVKSSPTEDGVFTTIWTYTQPLNATSGVRLAGGTGGVNSGITNARISGASLVN